jgi:N-acyl-D-amino-acid deacylase
MSSVFDLVVSGGRVIDGCGNPWYRADVGVRGDRIAVIAAPGTLQGASVVDACDRYVTPGFVDPHTHSDISILQYPRAESAVYQGVTTHVTGNCGMSPAPLTERHRDDLRRNWDHYWGSKGVDWRWRTFGQYLSAVEAAGTAINIVPLVGHGALRVAAMGFAERAATEAELALMERLLEAALRAGAHGLSSGLVYPPGCFAGSDELERLCAVAARHDGIYTTHIRGERETIMEAVAEAIETAQRAGLRRLQISHNAPKWGAPGEASANLALIEAARDAGLDVATDNDVHTDLAPRLSRALPQPVLDLEHDALLALLRDPHSRHELRRAIAEDTLPGAGYTGLVRHGRFDRITILHAGRHPELRGHSVAQIAEKRGRSGFDTYLDIILEEDDDVVGIFDYIEERSIRALLTHPLSMVSSDGLVMPPADQLDDPALYWPCSYGEYPGILERYVREQHVLRLEEAIRRMTSFPAQRFGLLDRGLLRPGLKADLVVFDLDRLHDRATNLFPHAYPFANIPHDHPDGIDHVVVNGVPVVADGRHTGDLPGRVLRRRQVAAAAASPAL